MSINSSKTNKTLLIGSIVTCAITGGAILVYILTRPPNKQIKVVRRVEIKLKNRKKELSKTDLCLVLQEISLGVQQTIMKVTQEERNIRKTPGVANHTPEQVQQYLLQHFKEIVSEVEHSVYTKNGVTEYKVKVANKAFENDKDVKRAVQQLVICQKYLLFLLKRDFKSLSENSSNIQKKNSKNS